MGIERDDYGDYTPWPGPWCRRCDRELEELEYEEQDGLCMDCACEHCRRREGDPVTGLCDPCYDMLNPDPTGD